MTKPFFKTWTLDSTIMETKEVKKLDMINGLQEGFSIIYFTARLFEKMFLVEVVLYHDVPN